MEKFFKILRSHSYRGDSNFNALFTPLTFLVTYFNSGINPLLYAFLSRNFRKGMRELLMCSWRGKSKTKSSINSSMHHKRAALQVNASIIIDKNAFHFNCYLANIKHITLSFYVHHPTMEASAIRALLRVYDSHFPYFHKYSIRFLNEMPIERGNHSRLLIYCLGLIKKDFKIFKYT